ncbi:MAG TPA: hypothetical protein VJI73_02575 [Candidatus Paceibacterota bacterium]
MDQRKIYAFSIALIVICLAFVFRWYKNQNPREYYSVNIQPNLGNVGSEHTHMSLLVFIYGKTFDFSTEQFQLKSDYTHFEDGDGITIHKHAKGVTLLLLLRSLGMEISSDCFTVNDKTRYCTDNNKTLKTYLNRKLFMDWETYELQQDDKILIDYGISTDTDIGLRLNSIPDLPDDL